MEAREDVDRDSSNYELWSGFKFEPPSLRYMVVRYRLRNISCTLAIFASSLNLQIVTAHRVSN